MVPPSLYQQKTFLKLFCTNLKICAKQFQERIRIDPHLSGGLFLNIFFKLFLFLAQNEIVFLYVFPYFLIVNYASTWKGIPEWPWGFIYLRELALFFFLFYTLLCYNNSYVLFEKIAAPLNIIFSKSWETNKISKQGCVEQLFFKLANSK